MLNVKDKNIDDENIDEKNVDEEKELHSFVFIFRRGDDDFMKIFGKELHFIRSIQVGERLSCQIIA